MLKVCMKTLGGFAFSIIISAQVTSVSEAKAADYLYNCNMSFSAKGRSVRVIGGYTRAKGTGVLSCLSYTDGSLTEIPISVSVKGVGLGLGVSGFNINGSAVGVGINKEPESLLGRYAKVSADVAFGIGLRTGVAARLNFKKGVAVIGVDFVGQSGIGAGVDLLDLNISRDESKKVLVSRKEHKKNHSKNEGLHKSLKRIDSDDYYDSHSSYHYKNSYGHDRDHKWKRHKDKSSVKVVRVGRGDLVKIVDHNGRLIRKLRID